MPELVEQMYCSQQIVIPPKFPYILKRFCKAAIKTQPYDLLRWSFEYFKALSERRAPPVKLRLEYPVYSTEGGLTRGCLKVLANQLSGTKGVVKAAWQGFCQRADSVMFLHFIAVGMKVVPMGVVKAAWQGFCLDPTELRRILCLCEVYLRADSVMFLHFIAVAGGFLTKSLTHTMILLCETLTKEPDGGSAAISVQDFLLMYKFLAHINADKDHKYINGFREGMQPKEEEVVEEEQTVQEEAVSETESSDSYWLDTNAEFQKLNLVDDQVPRTSKISSKLNQLLIGKLERSPSVERAAAIQRENYMKSRKARADQSDEVNAHLKQMKGTDAETSAEQDDASKPKEPADDDEESNGIQINVLDEDENPVELEIYGAPFEDYTFDANDEAAPAQSGVYQAHSAVETVSVTKPGEKNSEEEINDKEKILQYVAHCYQVREERREDLLDVFDEIAAIVERYKSANYDLGMVAGRQMSTTSGEFIVQTIEKEILAYIDEQIAVLPDPDLKKKKAKPEEVAMIKDMLVQFLDDNMDIICPDVEEIEEEEEPVPDVVVVYAVPGIGPSVDEDLIKDFEEYALEASKMQADVFMPRNIRHFMCPPLEKFPEYGYDKSKEEVPTPTGGVITD